MARGTAGASRNITVSEDTSLDRLWARGLSKVAVLAPPWVVTGLLPVIGAVFHTAWGTTPAALAFAAVGMTVATCILSALTWLVTHNRRLIGQVHSTVTTLFAGGWVTVATITGPLQSVTLYGLIVGGMAMAISWNIRVVIRSNTGDEESGVADPLAALFGKTSETAKLGGARMRTKEAGEHKIKAQLALPDGGEMTADDAMKRLPNAETGMRLPPGTLQGVKNIDRADLVNVTISDPRILREAISWPGPSRVGASIAEPLRIGLWQDADPVEYVIVGHHIQVMAKTGAGKSVGAFWNLASEIITRPDAELWVADLRKGEQTIGPLRPAIAKVATTKVEVKAMLDQLEAEIRPRTDHLAARGLEKWEPGCGLKYRIVHLEEAPDIFDAMGGKEEERFFQIMRAIRSAGCSVVISLQRADFTQMPTFVRAQLAFLCMGVATGDDAGFGLSEAQKDAGAAPELWGDRFPGMAYLDASTIPQERIAMPLRFYEINRKALTDLATEHPAQPDTTGTAGAGNGTASIHAVPTTTGELDGTAHADPEEDTEEEHDDPDTYVTEDDPDPDITATVATDDNIPDPDADEADIPLTGADDRGKMAPDQARAHLIKQLQQWASEGRTEFAPRDLAAVLVRVGMTRSWLHKHLGKLVDDGVLDRDDDEGCYRITAQQQAA